MLLNWVNYCFLVLGKRKTPSTCLTFAGIFQVAYTEVSPESCRFIPSIYSSFLIFNLVVYLDFYRASYASAVLGVAILHVRPSVCPSVSRVLCD